MSRRDSIARRDSTAKLFYTAKLYERHKLSQDKCILPRTLSVPEDETQLLDGWADIPLASARLVDSNV